MIRFKKPFDNFALYFYALYIVHFSSTYLNLHTHNTQTNNFNSKYSHTHTHTHTHNTSNNFKNYLFNKAFFIIMYLTSYVASSRSDEQNVTICSST